MKKLTLKKNLININIYSGHSATIHFFTSIAMQNFFYIRNLNQKKMTKIKKHTLYLT